MLKLNFYAVIVLFSLFQMPVNLIAQIPCATAERLIQKNFFSFGTGNVNVSSISQFGWVGTGNGVVEADPNRTFLFDNSNVQTFTQAITNVNLKGNGAVVSIQIGPSDGNPSGVTASFSVKYNGVLYATITTSSASGTGTKTASITYTNSASGSPATSATYTTPATAGFLWSIYLPASIPNAGNLQLVFTPNNSTPSTATADFTIFTVSFQACPIIYSGTVSIDANGLTNGVIDGTGSSLSGALSVGLYDASNTLIASGPVSPTGTYSISAAQSGPYTVRLIGLPSSYANTGEKLSAEPATGDGTPDGITSVITIANNTANTDKTGINFGIDALPQAAAVTNIVAGAPSVTSLSSAPIQGSDPEDMPVQGSWSGKTIVITSAPANGFVLKYSGTAVVPTTPIPNYDPALLTIEPGPSTPNGTSTASFQYATIDAAGKQASAAATYTINWTVPLPVVLTRFTASALNGDAKLQWEVENQENFRQYEIERALPMAGNFTLAGIVASNGRSSGSYSFTDTNAVQQGPMINYRLKMVDIDGRFSYSQVRSIGFGQQGTKAIVAPTVITGGQPMTVWVLATGSADMYEVRLINATGVTISQYRAPSQTKLYIETAGLAKGLYLVHVKGKDLEQTIKVFVQ